MQITLRPGSHSFSLHREGCLDNENCFKHFKVKLEVRSEQHISTQCTNDYLSDSLHFQFQKQQTYAN